MELRIFILGGGGQVKAQASGTDLVSLVYSAPYEEGDVITLSGDRSGYVTARLEETGRDRSDYRLPQEIEAECRR